MNIKKLMTGTLAAAIVATGLVFGVGKVYAAQIPYGENMPIIRRPAFNIYTNVPYGIGNEADFVRLRTSNGDPKVPAVTVPFTDPLNDACAVGSKFDIRTYIHNGATETLNNNGSGPAVAKDVNVAMQAPLGVTSNKFVFTSTISASNATKVDENGNVISEDGTVTDIGTLNCGTNVQLKLVPNTVKVYSRSSPGSHWVDAPDSAVNGNLAIGSVVPGSGDVWGCWDERVTVYYTVEVIEVPEEPVYSCDLLTAYSLGERRFRYTVRYTARNGATFKNVKFNFGDNTPVVTTTGTTATHTYAKDGTYTTRATVTFTVDGQDVTSTGQACTAQVSAQTPPDNCPIPGKTQLPANSPECKLPETGVGDMFGIFTATSVAGAAAHRVFNRRRSAGL